MKILKLTYWDLYSDWSIKSFELFRNLNLLVGISGAGKTSILNAIKTLNRIANGRAFDGIKWDVEFLTNNNIHYRWTGEFEVPKVVAEIEIEAFDDFVNLNENEATILYETIERKQNNVLEKIITRNHDKIIFRGQEIPRLNSSISIVDLLDGENDIIPVKTEFNNIDFATVDFLSINGGLILSKARIDGYDKKIFSVLQNSRESIPTKLLIAYLYYKDKFNHIIEQINTIFPQIDDIKIEASEVEKTSSPSSKPSYRLKFSDFIKIREKASSRWISQFNISSGMLKSLMYIATIELSPDGSVILIDEFENSLGVNCLDSITENLSDSSKNRDLQFIITSHHPYIVNNISSAYWKIITRKDGVITARNAEDYHISRSRHKAFIELINVLKDFPEGLDEE
jgi:ABC-type dipeptide/oligopeptide/nickel transport system ATPase subunit